MRVFAVVGVLLAGCNAPVHLNEADDTAPDRAPDEGTEAIPGADPGEPDLGGPDPVSDALFDVTRIHEVRVSLSSEAQVALTAFPREYAHADLEIGGELYEDVAVRLKGNNSFRDLDEKPSFKFKLDEFVSSNAHGRMTRFTLNNMIEDTTFARELLTYWLWNDAGMIAPRASYTRVWVNDTYFGLYLLLEPMDDAFLKRRFSDPTGDLWEGEDDADFTAAGVGFFDRKEGEGDTARLEAIAAALAQPTDDFYALANQHFQMDQVIDFWAWTMATANMDGYPYNLNDYIVYADPAADGRMVMSPWGQDESWNPAFDFQWGRGVALFECAADSACMVRVKDRTEAALQHYDAADVPGQLQAFYQLSAEAVADAPRSWHTTLEIEQARAELLTFVESWPTQLRAQIAAD